MNDSETALEHLRVIRSLMEKATVYRTVTVPTALIGGTAAVVAALALYFTDSELSAQLVIGIWLAVFFIVNAFHHGLIWRAARHDKEPYFSPGLSMALKAIIPAIFVGGVLGLTLGLGPKGDLIGTAFCWATFYGLALMATSGFSPRSLRLLGMAFTVYGACGLAAHWLIDLTELASAERLSALIMGFSFGLFHLVYALCVRALTNRAG